MQQSGTGGAVAMGFFEVGYQPMDNLHRELRDLLIALSSPDAGDYGATLLDLHEHLLSHCAMEERWMTGCDFPSRACHRQEHEMLLEVISEVRRRFDAGDVEIVQRLAAELPRWFEIHANTMDAALAFHLRDHTGEVVGALA
jgi:hemerythrin-like metal-binding protein